MPESPEHKFCKELLAIITGCRTETLIGPGRRADVACSPRVFFEIGCERKRSGERACHVEPRIKIEGKEYSLGRLNCNKLHTR